MIGWAVAYGVMFLFSTLHSLRFGAQLEALQAKDFPGVPPREFLRWRNYKTLGNWGFPVFMAAGTLQQVLEYLNEGSPLAQSLLMAMLAALFGMLFLWIGSWNLERRHGLGLGRSRD